MDALLEVLGAKEKEAREEVEAAKKKEKKHSKQYSEPGHGIKKRRAAHKRERQAVRKNRAKK